MATGIKIDTAMALVYAITNDEAVDSVWKPYIKKCLGKPKGYDRLIKDLNACTKGEKILTYTPDGVPAFLEGKNEAERTPS